MQSNPSPVGQIGVTGYNALLGQVATLGRTAQAIAGELARLSEANIDVSNRAVEKLSGARSLQDVASIQTELVRESIAKSQNHFRKIAEIAASTSGHAVENYREFVSTFTEAGRETARKAGDLARHSGEHVADATRYEGDIAAHNTEHFADAAFKNAGG